jgi:hypothetical protein
MYSEMEYTFTFMLYLICTGIMLEEEPSSSLSKVSDYGLDDRAIGVRSPVGAEDFSSILCVQTDCGAHPASCPMGTGGPFPGCKARPGRDADHSPHLVPRSWMSRSYTSSPPSAPMACSGTALLCIMLENMPVVSLRADNYLLKQIKLSVYYFLLASYVPVLSTGVNNFCTEQWYNLLQHYFHKSHCTYIYKVYIFK